MITLIEGQSDLMSAIARRFQDSATCKEGFGDRSARVRPKCQSAMGLPATVQESVHENTQQPANGLCADPTDDIGGNFVAHRDRENDRIALHPLGEAHSRIARFAS